jgi:glycosyltransferase involved in cell wall biosynthesis
VTKLLPGITVVIPSIPPRKALLERALRSVLAQTMPAAAVSVAVDLNREGAARTRQRALDAVQTRWVAFLDDDDELLPNHLAELFTATQDGAQYLWSRYRVAYPNPRDQVRLFRHPEGDPYPLGRGTFEQWNDEQPAQTTITTLVRTELARDVGGFVDSTNDWLGDGDKIDGQRAGEDWAFTLRCRAAAGLSGMRHVPVTTWTWHHHGRNTSGLPDRW